MIRPTVSYLIMLKSLKEFLEEKYFHAVKDADLMVVHTEWNEYRAINFNKIKKIISSPIILDLRNIFNSNELSKSGFKYYNIGEKMKHKFHTSILRAYDIRGIIGETLSANDSYNLDTSFLVIQER